MLAAAIAVWANDPAYQALINQPIGYTMVDLPRGAKTEAMMAECMRTRRVDVLQVGYHMLDRRQESETFPYCLTHGIGVMGYGSLGHGLLTGAFTASTTFEPGRDWRGNGVAFGSPLNEGGNGTGQRLSRE